MKKKILIVSDGNGVDGSNFIKWPSLLQLLCTKTLQIVNKSIIGASNEIIMLQAAEAIHNEPIDAAIIQWTVPRKLDVVATDFWQEQANIDPIYHFNIIRSNSKKWWVTSNSENKHIKAYHETYIQEWQATQRSQSYMLATASILKTANIPYVFCLAYNFNFIPPSEKTVKTLPWAWHHSNTGMCDFKQISSFLQYDRNLPQPHSLIQLEWIDKVMKPATDFIDYDQKVYYTIQNHLLKNNV